MNYADIKKYGKTITVDGKPFVKLFDSIANIMWTCEICSKAIAKKKLIKDIYKGMYGSEMIMALENVRTLKTLEAID